MNQRFWIPAIRLMNRLKYPWKFTLISLLFTLPLAVLLYSFLADLNTQINDTRIDENGLVYIGALRVLLEPLQRHRAFSYGLRSGRIQFKDAVLDEKGRVEEAIRLIDRLDRNFGTSLSTTQDWNDIKIQWERLNEANPSLSPHDELEARSSLIQRLVTLIARVADVSRLILDSDASVYHLVDVLSDKLPQEVEIAGRLRSLSMPYSGKTPMPVEEWTQMEVLSGDLSMQTQELAVGFQAAFQGNAPVQSRLMPLLEKSLDNQRILSRAFQGSLPAPLGKSIQRPDYFFLGTQSLNSFFILFDFTAVELSRILNARLHHLRVEECVTAAWIALILAIIGYLYVGFYRSVMVTVSKLSEASERMLGGQTGQLVVLENRDELGQVVKSFNTIAERLHTEWTQARNELTERTKAEVALRISEFRFRRLMDSNTIGISVASLKGDIFEANDESLRIFGFTRADLVAGRVNWAHSTPPEYRDSDDRAVRQLTSSGIAAPWEKEIVRPDGTRVPVMIGVAMLDAEQCIAFMLDNTERKKAEERSRQSDERFRQLAENIREVFWMADIEKSGVIYISPAYEKIWGRTCQSLYKQPASFLEAIHPDDRARVIKALDWRKTTDYDETYRIVQPQGDILWIHDRGFPIKDKSGRVYRMAGIAEDITERRKLEVVLHQSEKMSAVGRLAAGVAHEINNPLSVILGFAQALAKNVKEDDPAAMPLRSIEREAVRCKNLVQNLLAFSRQGPAKAQIFKTSEVFSSSLALIETQARMKSIEIKRETDGDEIFLNGDKNLIEQAIINLGSNAIDAMPHGGVLTISSSKAEENGRPFVRIQIKDTGMGMSEAVQKRLFEPFFTTKEPGKGTGLGLALVHETVEKHHGRINCQSREGQGTIFTMTLPACRAELLEAANERLASLPRSVA